ncbi:MAG TPA: dTMP kinase [Gammaproteobacteria bacterium]|nr:dTMP kinase [Gammaproteobacteria bacterium]
MSKARFISVEGIEGVGKSTHLAFIRDYLVSRGRDVLMTREPGGTPAAEKIRALLLEPGAEALSREAELLMMFAARALHVENVIRPALKAGHWVVCDRFVDASYAYQGGGRGIPAARIASLERWVLRGLKPDLTLLLDAPVAVGLTRMTQRGARDRFEREQTAFFNRVRRTYLARARREPRRVRVIAAHDGLSQVQTRIREQLDARLRRWL